MNFPIDYYECIHRENRKYTDRNKPGITIAQLCKILTNTVASVI